MKLRCRIFGHNTDPITGDEWRPSWICARCHDDLRKASA